MSATLRRSRANEIARATSRSNDEELGESVHILVKNKLNGPRESTVDHSPSRDIDKQSVPHCKAPQAVQLPRENKEFKKGETKSAMRAKVANGTGASPGMCRDCRGIQENPEKRMTNDLQEHALRLLSEFSEVLHQGGALFGSVARGVTDEARDMDVFFEYADDMKFSTEQVDTFTNFQSDLEEWLQLATQTLGKPVKPCCT